jgi:hypothetical protein
MVETPINRGICQATRLLRLGAEQGTLADVEHFNSLLYFLAQPTHLRVQVLHSVQFPPNGMIWPRHGSSGRRSPVAH